MKRSQLNATSLKAGALGQEPDGFVIRKIGTRAEYEACVDLQRETWGSEFEECVPPTILKIASRIGGLTAGAFDAQGRLAGFVFGMIGFADGRPLHWSHMLAVRPEVRNRGVGRRLKEFQRETLQALGTEYVYWTYDPLVARNAHLNLNRLGAQVLEYVVDMYGETGSALHGEGTDRFIVSWAIGPGRPAENSAGAEPATAYAVSAAPIANPSTDWSASAVIEDAPVIQIEIPADIDEIRARCAADAMIWRDQTRCAFVWYLSRGYAVQGFRRDAATGRCFYVLARGGSA